MRRIGWLLVVSGAALITALAVVIMVLIGYHHMFAIGIKFRPGSVLLVIPPLMMVTGLIILYRTRT